MPADALEAGEEDACLLDSDPAQQPLHEQSSPAAAVKVGRVDWVALLTAALLITAGVLSYYGFALQQLAAAHGFAAPPAAPAAVDFQAWVLDTLQPLPPRRLPDADPHIAVEEDGVRMYRQGGENYAMGSLSSRLQRLPLLTEWTDEACRFAFNPSVLERRSPAGLPETAGSVTTRSYDFHLNTQLASYSIYRNGTGHTRHDPNPWGWAMNHVLQQLTITVSSDSSSFHLSFSDRRRWGEGIQFGIDVRMLQHDQSLFAYDNWLHAYTLQMQAGNITFDAGFSRHRLHPFNDELAKNFMAASVDGRLYFVQRFSPFILVSCGTPDQLTDCELHSQLSLHDSLLPEWHTHWRGSTTLLPLPSHPHLLLGLIHERSTSGRDRTRDVYFNRFVVVDSHRWIPFAFTPPFGLFTNLSAVHWFEFIVSFAYLGPHELVLTLGYNDQEPWLCILPLHGVIRALQPVFEWQAAELSRVQANRKYSEQSTSW